MTCINVFYLRGARNYVDLNERLSHLNKALEHFQAYLNPGKPDRMPLSRTSRQSRGRQPPKLRLNLPETEVKQ